MAGGKVAAPWPVGLCLSAFLVVGTSALWERKEANQHSHFVLQAGVAWGMGSSLPPHCRVTGRGRSLPGVACTYTCFCLGEGLWPSQHILSVTLPPTERTFVSQSPSLMAANHFGIEVFAFFCSKGLIQGTNPRDSHAVPCVCHGPVPSASPAEGADTDSSERSTQVGALESKSHGLSLVFFFITSLFI